MSKGSLFAVLYTSNGLFGSGEHLGYEIVLIEENQEERPKIIGHRNRIQRTGEAPVTSFMEQSLKWAQGKYPDYVVGATRVRRGPMPPHPDSKKVPTTVLHELDSAIDDAKKALGENDRFVMGMLLARCFLKGLE